MASQLKNCSGCGRLYLDTGVGVCPDCRQKEEEAEEIIAAYVRENQGCTVADACNATGIPEKIVRRMIRHGRFSNLPGGAFSYPCAKCGTMINTGEYCPTCHRELTAELVAQQQKANAAAAAAARKTAGMYSMDNRNGRK